MTVKILGAWNGRSPGEIVTLDGATETRLINAGLATADLNYQASESGDMVRALRNTLTGRIKNSLNIGGVEQPLGVLNNSPTGVVLFGPEVGYSTPAVVNGAQCTINSTGAQSVAGEAWYSVSATATGATTNWFEVQVSSADGFSADSLVVEFSADSPASLSSVVAYMGANGYSIFAASSKPVGSAGGGTDPFKNRGRIAITYVSTDWIKSGYANSTNVQRWDAAKLRVYVANGATISFKLRSIRAGVGRSPGRIAVVADDGYRSFIRLGAPLLEQHGIPSTMAIISSEVGNIGAGVASLSDLENYVRAGNICVPHGPLRNSTNLFSAPYVDTAERIADMLACRDYLLEKGLTDSFGAKCYVFPQGVYASSSGEPDLLDAMQAAGFTIARTAVAGTSTPANRPQHVRALSVRSHQRLTLPIIGHTYAGVAATADSAAETSNIGAIVASIQALATNGSDGVLMLHKVVARGGATGGAGTIEIELDRLATIAAAIQTEVNTGKLRAVLLSDFAVF